MKNQVLSIEQMQKLKELGIDINKASMCYISKYPSCDFDDGDSIVVVSKDFNKRLYNEFGPAFTLQDIIKLLPAQITTKNVYDLIICDDFFQYSLFGENIYTSKYVLCYFYNETNLLHAAYEMLVWVAENGYLKTK